MNDHDSRAITLWCPVCRDAALEPHDDHLSCPACGERFEVVAGIADLRHPAIAYDVEADRALALELHAAAPESDFESLLRRYWESAGADRPELVDRFVRGDLVGAARAAVVAEQIAEMVGDIAHAGARVLEIGSGTAALGSVMAERGAEVVATDVSLAWLVLARRRLDDAGIEGMQLVACTGDHLPFDTGTFDLVVAADVIEHVPDADAMVLESNRVLRPDGALWVSTPNRYSLTPEPHVRLLGVGFLPRRVALRYVQRYRGVDYSDIRVLSGPALRKTLARGGEVELTAPRIAGPVRDGYSPGARVLIDGYNALAGHPLTSKGLLVVTPLFHATMRKAAPSG